LSIEREETVEEVERERRGGDRKMTGGEGGCRNNLSVAVVGIQIALGLVKARVRSLSLSALGAHPPVQK
jgi:hypothetical protein